MEQYVHGQHTAPLRAPDTASCWVIEGYWGHLLAELHAVNTAFNSAIVIDLWRENEGNNPLILIFRKKVTQPCTQLYVKCPQIHV